MPDVRARELLDIAGRLQAMDVMRVDTQVVYPTLFLAYMTDDVKLKVALCRAYNRFMAGVWGQGQGRLRWVVVPPLRSIDASIAEINFAEVFANMRSREDVPSAIIDKMLSDNSRNLYGLPA